MQQNAAPGNLLQLGAKIGTADPTVLRMVFFALHNKPALLLAQASSKLAWRWVRLRQVIWIQSQQIIVRAGEMVYAWRRLGFPFAAIAVSMKMVLLQARAG
jgi:hypothetical protein